LGLTAEHQAAIIEMGMNRFGEIRRLARMVQPSIGVLTNVYPAHTEGLGSLAGVAQAKSELLEALSPGDTLIYNGDDCLLQEAAARFGGRTLSFGLNPGCALTVREYHALGLQGQEALFSYNGACWPARLKIVGLHHLYNALAATAIGLALGLDPEVLSAGLAGFSSLDKRTQVLRLTGGAQLINDCYNANPGSMGQALRTLAQAKNRGRAIAVLGDMLELGEATVPAHCDLGSLAAQLQVDVLVVCGQFRQHVAAGAQAAGMPACRIFPVDSHDQGAEIVADLLQQDDILLVKGSRGSQMEKFIAALP
jgi:UDP-N-acetylmuramyl pentapeptide synthase